MYHFTPAICIFFFNDTPTTEIYTLSLHDALPISVVDVEFEPGRLPSIYSALLVEGVENKDRKSTRLNSSHVSISYAVFCLKKKKKQCRLTRLIASTSRVDVKNARSPRVLRHLTEW